MNMWPQQQQLMALESWAYAAFAWLGEEPGRLAIWGAFTRLLALVFAISLAGIGWNLVPLSGRHGMVPASHNFAAFKRDFGRRAYWYSPSVFWVTGTSNAALRIVPLVGVCAALAAAVGYHSQLGLLIAWATLLSIDNGVHGAGYPWDSFLLENGFLALFLPAVPNALTTGSMATSRLPSPLLAWAFRWLLARLLLGFGKLKFQGSGWRDRYYIKGFLLSQPMVSPLGYLAYQLLPDFAYPALLFGMWLTEIPLPMLQLATSGLPRAVAGASIIFLMLGIQVVGNFGYFNVLTAVAAITALDHSSVISLTDWRHNLLQPGSALPAELAAVAQCAHGVSTGGCNSASVFSHLARILFSHWREVAFPLLLAAYLLPVSLLQFVMNSWINLSWAHWSGVYRLKLPFALRWSQWYASALRCLQQFRLVHGYGVFPPQSSPPQRWAVVYEGSDDGGLTWKRYEYAYYLSGPRTPPRFIAPYHPRLDHAVFYYSFGSAGDGPTGFLMTAHPYNYHASANAWVQLQQALLDPVRSATVSPLFRHNPFPSGPPQQVRALICSYVPTPLAHALATGEYWAETVMGTQLPAASLEACRQQSAMTSVPPNGASSSVQPAAADAADDDDAASAQQLWPLSDGQAGGPEDFWCELLFWRRRGGQTVGVLTSADYEAVWRFIADVRVAAAEAAAAAAASAGQTGNRGDFATVELVATVASQPVTSSQVPPVPLDVLDRTHLRMTPDWAVVEGASRTVLQALGIISTPDISGTRGEPAAKAPAANNGSAARSRSRSKSRGRSVAAAKPSAAVVMTSPPSAPSAAAVVAGAAGALGPLSVSAAHEVFVWSFLPAALARVRQTYNAAELVALRRSICRMSLPLMLACERLFDLPVLWPVNAETLRRAATAHATFLHPADAEEESCFFDLLDVLRAGQDFAPDASLPQRDGSSAGGSSSSVGSGTTTDGFPIYVFRGNDDAGPQYSPGRMSGPLQWNMHIQYLLLVGGRQAYEAAVTSVTGGPVSAFLLNQRLPTVLSHPAAACIAQRPLRHLYAGLSIITTTANPSLSSSSNGSEPTVVRPGDAPTEASLFLPMLLSYNSWATTVIGTHRASSITRPNSTRVTSPQGRLPSFMPAAMSLLPRLLAHPSLRRLYDDYGLSTPGASAPGAGAAAADPFLPLSRVHRWQQSADQSLWTRAGLHMEGQALSGLAVANAAAAADGVQLGRLLVLYDGVCRLCNGVVAFLLKRDPDASRFQFCAIQSAAGRRVLSQLGISEEEALQSFTVVDQRTGAHYRKSTAAVVLSSRLNPAYQAIGALGGLLFPLRVRDAIYGVVAASRYALFGTLRGDESDRCLPATSSVLARFLDADEIRANLKEQAAALRAAAKKAL